MPMDPAPVWTQELANLAPDKDQSGGWADKFASKIDERVTNKLQIAGITGQVSFTFQKGLFATMLKADAPNPAQPAAMQIIANAWQTAMLASTIVVSPGSFVGVSAPPTLFSAVIIAMILPPSIMAAQAILLAQLSAAPPVPQAMGSQMGPAFFAAFSTLQVMVSGINSVPPPAGPQPLILPTLPVI